MKKNLWLAVVLSLVASFAAAAPAAAAKPREHKAVVNHLKTKYGAKKVKVPFMWLARFAVRVVRPAGVKSFSVTLFDGLQLSGDKIDAEMQQVMRSSFDENWIPIFRVRSRDGQQAYMYMREAGENVRLTLVTIDKQEAAVIRATFNPEKLADFINNPKIFGISLDQNGEEAKEIEKPKAEPATEEPKN